jgi:hypothetical protein
MQHSKKSGLSKDTLRRRLHRNPIPIPKNQTVPDKRRKVDVNLAKQEISRADIRHKSRS